MYKVIVVGTDGSERASLAVKHALELAKLTGGKVHAVQVVHAAAHAGFADSSGTQIEIDSLREHADQTRSNLLAEAAERGLEIEIHNPGGADVAESLVSVAESVDADLIVVGNRGMSGLSRFIMGSVPNKVAHHSPCSVLIVDTGD